MTVSLIIPALNEGESLGPLLATIPAGLVEQVIVVDNGSSDGTSRVAAAAGALVVDEPRRGYGYACAAGARQAGGDILVFMDGDGSFLPAELARLLVPLDDGRADLVLGSRTLGNPAPLGLPSHQVLGNRLFTGLVGRFYGVQLTDLGPFRAIRRGLLNVLDMREFTYGWPLEMIIKTARRGRPILEVPITCRPRYAGRSKVSGTWRGSLLTAYRYSRVVLYYSF